MKTIFRLTIISLLMLVAAPTWADEVRHVYHCVQEDEANDDALAEISSEWVMRVLEEFWSRTPALYSGLTSG